MTNIKNLTYKEQVRLLKEITSSLPDGGSAVTITHNGIKSPGWIYKHPDRDRYVVCQDIMNGFNGLDTKGFKYQWIIRNDFDVFNLIALTNHPYTGCSLCGRSFIHILPEDTMCNDCIRITNACTKTTSEETKLMFDNLGGVLKSLDLSGCWRRGIHVNANGDTLYLNSLSVEYIINIINQFRNRHLINPLINFLIDRGVHLNYLRGRYHMTEPQAQRTSSLEVISETFS